MDSQSRTFDDVRICCGVVLPTISQRHPITWTDRWHHLDALSYLNHLTGLLTYAQDVGAADAAPNSIPASV